MSDERLADWLTLAGVPGIGPVHLRRLLASIGLPTAVLGASRSSLLAVVGEREAHAIAAARDDAASRGSVAAALVWAGMEGNRILTLDDPDYPGELLNVPDPPPILYLKGRVELLARPAVAIVGSRNATPQGEANAQAFARALSEAGVTVVSGLALGIDAAAHRGALAARGSSIAVIGTGADIVYPSRNHELARELAREGLVVSEFPLGTRALAANFPRRNRIISGLARGVLVVEAAVKSGSLITARLAAEQGREVFAIPGSIHSPLSRGCHALIRQGAKLVETAEDILEEFGFARTPAATRAGNAPPAPSSDDAAAKLLAAMGHDPLSVDALAARTGLAMDALAALLLELELEGRIAMLAGARVQRVER